MSLPMLRQSERASFKRCNWAWYQRHVLGLAPRVERKDEADFGTIWHECMAEYYIPGLVRGPHPAETWAERAKVHINDTVKTRENVSGEEVAKWEDFYPLGLDLAEAYVDLYQGDPSWEILDAERRFTVLIPDTRIKPLISDKGKRGYTPIVNLVGTFDLCYRDLVDGKVKLLDHKTATSIGSFDHLTLDEQASTYIAVGTFALRNQGLIGPKDQIHGMEYNYIRRGKMFKEPLKPALLAALLSQGIKFAPNSKKDGQLDPVEKLLKEDLAKECEAMNIKVKGEPSDSPTFMRHFVPRTPTERQRQIVRISEEAQVMAEVRAGRQPALKTPTPNCRYCAVFDLCELDESGGDTDYFKETTMIKVDPYGDHRDGAINSKKLSEAQSSQKEKEK